jgi:exonuclease SbcD
MRILHTSDWHLGHRLCEHDRQEEHERFLNWLIGQLKELSVDVLIVAGDIFDIPYPPNFALAEYYNFLRRIPETPCRHMVVIGGNHDAVSTLNAPRELLKFFRIDVIGGAEEELAREIVPVVGESGQLQALIAAVPFLRDRDIKKAVAGETYEAKEKAIVNGIINHYFGVKEKALEFLERTGSLKVPLIAVGHLYAAGCLKTDSERDIYIGNLGKVAAEAFPPEFDYVALGHLHRAQAVNSDERIQYSGSPLPLSFSEAGTTKTVHLVEFNPHLCVTHVKVPLVRRLVRLQGSIAKIQEMLQALSEPSVREELTPWAEVVVEAQHYDPLLHGLVMDTARGLPVEVLMVKTDRQYIYHGLNEQVDSHVHLEELTPEEVFAKKCEVLESNDKELVMQAFTELRALMEIA